MGIKNKQIKQLGFDDNVNCSLIVNIISKHCKHTAEQDVIDVLQQIKANPSSFWSDDVWAPLALRLQPKPVMDMGKDYELLSKPLDYAIYGVEQIEELARKQMEMALRLPISVAGALMPDAHSGYGLPIGGVLATQGAVIPYAVGLDIGCRMRLTIVDVAENYLKRYEDQVTRALLQKTHFGMEGGLPFRQDHPVMHHADFREIPLLKRWKEKARLQLGSSGSGNHFVEFGVVDIPKENDLGVEEGRYVALLSHSGSRGLGAEVARDFCSVARERCRLPREAGHFAWLELASEEGESYWRCMQLAGLYAQACHELIHYNVLHDLGLKPLLTIENHHNFAWKEMFRGEDVVVHRKGATPAKKGELGIIPGSMGTAGYLVSGLGNEASIYSASHGAGRLMSRQDARNSVTWNALHRQLEEAGVKLIGGSVEEAPFAYKGIEDVISSQSDLVKVVGRFMPKIVRMNKE